MPSDSTALTPVHDQNTHSPLAEADYDAICSAVMETWRGRWFLAEYARRNRSADTSVVLNAIDRLEAVIQRDRKAPPADQFRFDIIEMAKAIAKTKKEISAIKPDAEHHGKIGEMTEQLDSIVAATEKATSSILAAAEQVQEVAWTMREQGMDSTLCDQLDHRATEIYTACSFQDITGQRTEKVIDVMRYLERRINAMIEIWGDDLGDLAEDDVSNSPATETLENGPALPGTGMDQADVDLMMGGAVAVAEAPNMAPPTEPADETTPVAAVAETTSTHTVTDDTETTVPQETIDDADILEPVAVISVEISEQSPDLVPTPDATTEASAVAAAPELAATPTTAAASDPAPSEPVKVEIAPPSKPAIAAKPGDPLASVAALSDDEKVALFS